jgi:hypothetical protein
MFRVPKAWHFVGAFPQVVEDIVGVVADRATPRKSVRPEKLLLPSSQEEAALSEEKYALPAIIGPNRDCRSSRA